MIPLLMSNAYGFRVIGDPYVGAGPSSVPANPAPPHDGAVAPPPIPTPAPTPAPAPLVTPHPATTASCGCSTRDLSAAGRIALPTSASTIGVTSVHAPTPTPLAPAVAPSGIEAWARAHTGILALVAVVVAVVALGGRR